VTKVAEAIVVREFGCGDAIRQAIEQIAGAQAASDRRANKVFIVSAALQRIAQMPMKWHCRERDAYAVRIDRPIEAGTL